MGMKEGTGSWAGREVQDQGQESRNRIRGRKAGTLSGCRKAGTGLGAGRQVQDQRQEGRYKIRGRNA